MGYMSLNYLLPGILYLKKEGEKDEKGQPEKELERSDDSDGSKMEPPSSSDAARQ